jgi:hypothetical protein
VQMGSHRAGTAAAASADEIDRTGVLASAGKARALRGPACGSAVVSCRCDV